jgi:hypothetical protein
MKHEDIIRMAREADLLTTTEPNGYQVWIPENLEAFANLVAAAEREACAKVCEKDAELLRVGTPPQIALMEAAAAIRERGAP